MRDLEELLQKIQDYFREDLGGITRLNKCIQSINTEKGDTLLQEITNVDRNFVLNGSYRETITQANFVDIGLDGKGDFKMDVISGGYASSARIKIQICFYDNISNDDYKRGLRYQRAIATLMSEFNDYQSELGQYDDVKGFVSPVSIRGVDAICSGVSMIFNLVK